MATRKGASKSAPRKKSSSGSDPKSKRTVHNKMETVMHEFKHHELKSGTGKPVRNPKQAIAIGLSEARRSGADIPPNPNESKKSGAKKGAPKGKKASRKTAAKQTGAKKASGKKAVPKKAAKRTASKRKAAPRKR